jgi:hypothetical protein
MRESGGLAFAPAVVIEQIALDEAAKGHDVLGSVAGPPHAGELGSLVKKLRKFMIEEAFEQSRGIA